MIPDEDKRIEERFRAIVSPLDPTPDEEEKHSTWLPFFVRLIFFWPFRS